jgi:hypothetical protein
MSQFKFVAIFYSLICIFFLSCQDSYNICDKSTKVSLKGGFYHVTGSNENVVSASSLTITSINSGVIIYNQQADLSKFTFSLNPTINQALYFIKTDNTSIGDTLTLTYSTESANISAECGNVYVNTLQSITSTHNTLDSVKLIETNNNTTTGENIKIYF